MDAQEARKAQAQLGNAKEQEIYPVTNQKNQTILVKDELKPEHTLFIKGTSSINPANYIFTAIFPSSIYFFSLLISSIKGVRIVQ
jgi:hypothetical protein